MTARKAANVTLEKTYLLINASKIRLTATKINFYVLGQKSAGFVILFESFNMFACGFFV